MVSVAGAAGAMALPGTAVVADMLGSAGASPIGSGLEGMSPWLDPAAARRERQGRAASVHAGPLERPASD